MDWNRVETKIIGFFLILIFFEVFSNFLNPSNSPASPEEKVQYSEDLPNYYQEAKSDENNNQILNDNSAPQSNENDTVYIHFKYCNG